MSVARSRARQPREVLKIILDNAGTLSYITAVPPTGGRAREAFVTWGGMRRLRPGLREPRARELLGPIRRRHFGGVVV
jgi:hypothetical protein